MPGWSGDHREDEVWAMVAFLRTYQKLTLQEYVRLANGDVYSTGGDHAGAIGFDDVDSHMDKTLQTCARCHGADGMGRDGTAPKIAGQSRQYLTATLAGYATGRRSCAFFRHAVQCGQNRPQQSNHNSHNGGIPLKPVSCAPVSCVRCKIAAAFVHLPSGQAGGSNTDQLLSIQTLGGGACRGRFCQVAATLGFALSILRPPPCPEIRCGSAPRPEP
jgi:hypothetical protein